MRSSLFEETLTFSSRLSARAGSAEEPANFIREDHGDSVRPGLGAAGRLQAAAAHRGAHVHLSDPAAQPRRGDPPFQRRPQPAGGGQGNRNDTQQMNRLLK